MLFYFLLFVAVSLYALVQEYKINKKLEDGTSKHSDERKKLLRAWYWQVIQFIVLLIIVVSLGNYFFGSSTDLKEWSDNNYIRP
jgi:Ca2+/Na+ antiporter